MNLMVLLSIYDIGLVLFVKAASHETMWKPESKRLLFSNTGTNPTGKAIRDGIERFAENIPLNENTR